MKLKDVWVNAKTFAQELSLEIDTYDQLVHHLEVAVLLELGVIPVYFTGLYSIKDQNAPSARLIRGVMVEEMLHLALNCNLMNAIGARPSFARELLPEYPMALPYYYEPDVRIILRKASPEAARDTYMRIELPAAQYEWGAPWPPEGNHWHTLGQFYEAIIQGFRHISQIEDIFTGDPAMQYPPHSIYETGDGVGGGVLRNITNVEQAVNAIRENLEQTQGPDGADEQPFGPGGSTQLTHYARFRELADGTVPVGETWNMYPNLQTEQLEGAVRLLSELFNQTWGLMIQALRDTFGKPAAYAVYYSQAMTLMRSVMPPLAMLLFRQPIHEADNGEIFHAGPSFQYRDQPIDAVAAFAREVLATAPDPSWRVVLEQVAAALEYMREQTRAIEREAMGI